MLRQTPHRFPGFAVRCPPVIYIPYLLAFEQLIDTGADSELCFRPLEPRLETKMFIIWKKYQVFSPIAGLLLDKLKSSFQ